MGILRKTVQRAVLDILDRSIYTSDDFEVVFGDPQREQYLLTVKFLHAEKYLYLISSHQTSQKKMFHVTRSPGRLEETETYVHSDLNNAFNGIASWCNEIRDELKAETPIYREIDELRSALKDHLAGSSKTEEFTVAEINTLKEKFEELQKRVSDLEAQNIITTSQSEQFKEGIEQVSKDIEFYPKETWLKTATNKITRLVANIGKSPEGRKLISDGARKLLNLE